jgi:hypothetical protein
MFLNLFKKKQIIEQPIEIESEICNKEEIIDDKTKILLIKNNLEESLILLDSINSMCFKFDIQDRIKEAINRLY